MVALSKQSCRLSYTSSLDRKRHYCRNVFPFSNLNVSCPISKWNLLLSFWIFILTQARNSTVRRFELYMLIGSGRL